MSPTSSSELPFCIIWFPIGGLLILAFHTDYAAFHNFFSLADHSWQNNLCFNLLIVWCIPPCPLGGMMCFLHQKVLQFYWYPQLLFRRQVLLYTKFSDIQRSSTDPWKNVTFFIRAWYSGAVTCGDVRWIQPYRVDMHSRQCLRDDILAVRCQNQKIVA